MQFSKFVQKFQNLPIVQTPVLHAGLKNVSSLKVQISRWQRSDKLIQLRRGVYLFAEPYRKVEMFEPYLAATLQHPSYISLEKALEYYDLIPEAVSVYTSVTTKRPGRFTTKVGIFDYRHIQTPLFWGYTSIELNRQTAFMAFPEKALLDLIYLRHINVSLDYLEELRLQNVERINLNTLFEYAKRFNKPKISRAAEVIQAYIKKYQAGEKSL